MRRKLIFIILNTFLLILITGCWNYTEVEDQLLVAGFAVDQGEGEVPYMVTVEVVLPEMSEQTKLLQADGYTVLDALRNIASISGKKLYLGHCKVIIICSSLAEEGIIPILDIAARDHELRFSINIVISKDCPAWEVFNQESIDNIKSAQISKTIKEDSSVLGKTFSVNISELVNTMNSEGVALLLPKMEKIYSANKPVFRIAGLAVFDDDKLVGYLTPEETKFVLMIRNDLNGGVLLVKQEGKPEFQNKEMSIGYEILKNKTKIKFMSKDEDKLVFTVTIKTDVSLSDHDPKKEYSIKNTGYFCKSLESSIEDSTLFVFNNVRDKFDVDVFGFGNHLYKHNIKVWMQVKSIWNELYKNIELDVNSKVNIKQSGLTRYVFEAGEKK